MAFYQSYTSALGKHSVLFFLLSPSWASYRPNSGTFSFKFLTNETTSHDKDALYFSPVIIPRSIYG